MTRRTGTAPGFQRAADWLPPPEPPIFDDALARAIEQDSIEMLFQPQFDVDTGRVAGVEALARWSGEAVAETLFRRAASSRLAERLSRHAQLRALRSAGRWSGGLAQLGLSINVLADDLCRRGYADWLLDQIRLAGIEPQRVTVEITEGELIVDHAGAARRLSRLRAAGLSIAVDDFGTGYCNLAYLLRLPIDTLKLDKSLIRDIAERRPDRVLVKAMIGMVRELGLKLVVEGVETPEQLALVRQWGGGLYQGWLGAPALTDAELEMFVERVNG